MILHRRRDFSIDRAELQTMKAGCSEPWAGTWRAGSSLLDTWNSVGMWDTSVHKKEQWELLVH